MTTAKLNINKLEVRKLKGNNTTLVKVPCIIEVKEKALQASTKLNLSPYFVDVEHYDGRTIKTDLYYIASRVFFRTLARAYSNHAMDIYEKPFGMYYDITKDYIQEVTCAMYLGYTNKKGEHFKGYADGVTNFRQLALVGYKAINAMLYANGVQGRNIGKVVTVSDNKLIELIAMYDYIRRDTSNINMVRFNQFITDVKNNLTTKQLEVFNCILDGAYSNADGTFSTNLIASDLNRTKQSVNNIISRIRRTAKDVVLSNYNMDTYTFTLWLQNADDKTVRVVIAM